MHHRFKNILRRVWSAVRANILPGLLLQTLMAIFVGAYLLHDGTRVFLAHVAELKQQAGYIFAAVSYVLAGAILPEILQIFFFQKGRSYRFNFRNMATATPCWIFMGWLGDYFYRWQAVWFGTAVDLATIVPKILVDQLLFSPFLCTPLLLAYYHWRDAGFSLAGVRLIFRKAFPEEVLTVQAAGWCIWFPGTALVYSMPSTLQIPVAVFIQAFWVLVFTVVKRPRESVASRR